MKKVLMEVPEKCEGLCDGCFFFIKRDACFNVVCQRLLVKGKDCKDKIFVLKEIKDSKSSKNN